MDANLINKLSNKIQYIGCDDASLDLFENQYPLPNGMCYNSYLLLGERVAVMDSVDKRKTAEWLQKIEQFHHSHTLTQKQIAIVTHAISQRVLTLKEV